MEKVTAYKSNDGVMYGTEKEAFDADLRHQLQEVCNTINNNLPLLDKRHITPDILFKHRIVLIRALNATPNEALPVNELKQ